MESEEHRQLRTSLRSFFDDVASESAVREIAASESGHAADVWATISADLGLPGLAIAEAYGGSGYGVVEQAIVMEEMGRVLLPSPYLPSAVLAANLLTRLLPDPDAAELLEAIATGTIVTVAMAEADGQLTVDRSTTEAASSEQDTRLNGQKWFVIDGEIAEVLLVVAATPDGPAVFRVDPGADNLSRTGMRTMDLTRRQAQITLRDVPGRRLGAPGQASSAVPHMLERARVLLAAEQVGGAAACRDMAVDYAKVRTQFGRAIGSFQAVKHTCADMHLEVELARATAQHAIAAAAADEPLAEVSAIAALRCSDAYMAVTAANIQVHGGIGFTWEHAAHLYYRRARAARVLLGEPRERRRELAGTLGMGTSA